MHWIRVLIVSHQIFNDASLLSFIFISEGGFLDFVIYLMGRFESPIVFLYFTFLKVQDTLEKLILWPWLETLEGMGAVVAMEEKNYYKY